ncbi:MAG: 16S rRNA (cytidine(1402)-2'-O)-methyltransferase [Myxococcota bacterium]
MLTVCPTPIGNLEDITERQRRALAAAELIACEDTRRTGKLLELLGIERVDGTPRLLSVHEHNELERVDEVMRALGAGKDVVLASDAGTPTISDPGYVIVREAASRGYKVETLPGPSAAITALSGSGLPTDRFFFEGFLPAKLKARRERLEAVGGLGVTVVCYESPHRLTDALEDACDVLGDSRLVVVARELTKMHEEFVRGSAREVLEEFAGRSEIQGELVLLIGPPADDESEEDMEARLDDKIRELLEDGMRPRGIKEVVSELFDVSRSSLYDRIERIKNES